MEVTCDRCNAEYEFEETLVADGGTTVKCTSCGHLFKLTRIKPPVPEAEDKPETESGAQEEPKARWTVRGPEGSTLKADSLRQLVVKISEGELTESHTISHSGRSWKRLGDIEELQAFFLEARKTDPADPKHAQALIGKPGRDASVPPPTPAPKAEAPPGPEVASRPPRVPAPVTADGSSQPLPPPEEGETSQSRPARPLSPLDPPSRAPEAVPDDGQSDPLPEPQLSEVSYPEFARPRLRKRWAALLLLAAALTGSAALWWPNIQALLDSRQGGVTMRRFVERADRALAAYRTEKFAVAITEYTKALAFHEEDPHLLSALSRTHARWSQLLRMRANLIEAGLLTRPADELVRMRDESRALTRRAKETARSAARKNPGNSEAEIALADALRLSRNLVAARAELDRARATETTPRGETLRVAAHLAIAEAGGDLAAGRKLAREAVAREPEELTFRVLLTYLLISTHELETADYHLRALKNRTPSHPMVADLTEALRTTRDKPPVEVVPAPIVVDAGTPGGDAGVTETQEETAPEEASTESTPPNAPPAKVLGLIRQGERWLDRGMTSRAQKVLEEALEVESGNARAQSGLGFVFLERGRTRQAHGLFVKASRGGHAEAYIGLGATLREMKRYKAALKAYQTYSRRYPKGRSVSIAARQITLLEEMIAKKK